jgi:hypothetical protein
MIQLEHYLLFEARRLMTGADVHRMKEMIFAYEQAVELHNSDHPSHRRYQPEHESLLRCYVVERLIEKIDRQIRPARRYSLRLSETTNRRDTRLNMHSERSLDLLVDCKVSAA